MNHVAYAPPGWPQRIRPPGLPGWESTASKWLLDQCPGEYRNYPVLRHHVVLLARFTALHVEACQAAVRRGLSQARGDLRDLVDSRALEAAILAWQREEARLMSLQREVVLVEEALRGRRYVPRL